MNYAPILRNS
ncbi:hypothetical protein AB3S75_041447 [Citrus x aurantiifolia]